MSNRSNNKITAKTQTILCLAMLLLFGATSCRKEIYLRANWPTMEISYNINIDVLRIDWTAEWQYPVDAIGYTTNPQLVQGYIFDVSSGTRRYYSEHIFKTGQNRVSLKAGSTYDMLFYNIGPSEEYNIISSPDNHKTYTATTNPTREQTSWLRTSSETNSRNNSGNDINVTIHNQPREEFGTLKSGLEISEDLDKYEKEYDEKGNITYIYKIKAPMYPYTFIYQYQIVILNNPDEKGNRIKNAKGVTVSGLAKSVELFSRKTSTSTIGITADELNPIKNVKNVRLQDGTIIDNADIFTTRIVTWGLPGINPLESFISQYETENQQGTSIRATKADNDDESNKNLIGIGFTLRNDYQWTKIVDITRQMQEKPIGGVITIYIDAQEIPQELLDKKQQTTGGGFDANVKDWENSFDSEVTI